VFFDQHKTKVFIRLQEGLPEQWALYSPSTCWSSGGPLIEREHIEIITAWDHGWEAGINCLTGDGMSAGFGGLGQRGETPLIAAMRAYVASKFGDTVEDS
jgi:hypothetical protein